MVTRRNPTSGGRRAEADRNDVLVLAAARDTFLELDWDAPMSAVAQRAGTGMGTIYRRYPSKTALLRDLCLSALTYATQQLHDALKDESTSWDALVRFAVTMTEGQACGVFVLIGRLPTGAGELNAAAAQFRESLGLLVAGARDEGALLPTVTETDVYVVLTQQRTLPSAPADRLAVLRLRYLGFALRGLADSGHPRVASALNGLLDGDPPQWNELTFKESPPLEG